MLFFFLPFPGPVGAPPFPSPLSELSPLANGASRSDSPSEGVGGGGVERGGGDRGGTSPLEEGEEEEE